MSMSYFPTVEEIKEFRIKLGIKQHELAKATGLSTNMISQIETKRANPNTENYKKIFEYLYQKSDEKEVRLNDIQAIPLTFLRPGQTAKDAKKVFDSSADFDVLPVLNNDKNMLLMGKISRIGLEEYLKTHNKELDSIMINDILEESPPVIPHDTPKQWIRNFLQVQNNCVLVSKYGKITGIVNAWDYITK